MVSVLLCEVWSRKEVWQKVLLYAYLFAQYALLKTYCVQVHALQYCNRHIHYTVCWNLAHYEVAEA